MIRRDWGDPEWLINVCQGQAGEDHCPECCLVAVGATGHVDRIWEADDGSVRQIEP